MKKIILLIGLLLISIASYGSTRQHALGSASNPVKVGFSEGIPFSYFYQGKPTGLAIKLWEIIAKEKNWHYTFVPMDENVDTAIQAVKDHKIDLLIGPISVNHERIKLVNYTRPYYINQIGLATNTDKVSAIAAIKRILDHLNYIDLLIMLSVFFVFCNLIWFLEIRKMPGHRTENYFQGITYSAWLSLSHFLRGGFFLRSQDLKSNLTKIACTLWFFFTLVFLTLLTSTLTAFIAKDLIHAPSSIQRASDLTGKRLAYVIGRESKAYIQEVHGTPIAFKHVPQALAQLKNHEIDGVVEDYIILKDEIIRSGLQKKITMSPFTLANDEFAFALPYGSTLLKPINNEIVKLQDNKEMFFICSRFLGDHAKDCQL